MLAAPGSSQGFDPFAYVFNDPLSFADPSGFEPEPAAGGEAPPDAVAESGPNSLPAPDWSIPALPWVVWGGGSGGQGPKPVDAEMETEAGGEGAAGEPIGAVDLVGQAWRQGYAPLDESTKVTLPRVPTPDLLPPTGGSPSSNFWWGFKNGLLGPVSGTVFALNLGLGIAEGVGNIHHSAVRGGELYGRAIVRMDRCMEAQNCGASDVLGSIDDTVQGGNALGESATSMAVAGGLARWVLRAGAGGPSATAAGGGGGRNFVQDLLSIKRQKGLGDIATGTRAEAETIGRAWVNGKNVKRFDLKDGGFGLTDGTRSFRLQYKPKNGVWKANFQENTFVPGRSRGIEVKNIHMTITDMVAP